ncbi:hypothetical protein B7494_g289 [Chlorociboria aeruginascens]|nr:hypothetical protein B7494_g289 [Chlorociboria aeruginascens]
MSLVARAVGNKGGLAENSAGMEPGMKASTGGGGNMGERGTTSIPEELIQLRYANLRATHDSASLSRGAQRHEAAYLESANVGAPRSFYALLFVQGEAYPPPPLPRSEDAVMKTSMVCS